MENLSHLFAAYTAIWIILFSYVVYLQRCQKNLQQEIELLGQKLKGEPENSPS